MCRLDEGLRARALRVFRVAPPASHRANLLKTLAQATVLWTLALGVVPVILSRIERDWLWPSFRFPGQAWLPWVCFALASTLGLTSAGFMAVFGKGTPLPLATARQLVVRGPYRVVRNPMAVAGLLQGASVGAALGSVLVLAYAAAGGFLWNFVARPLEEADLEHRFGQGFRHYRDRIRCWIPRLRPYEPTE